MPQLTGPEQKELVELLAPHIGNEGQLDRALLYAGLGKLSDYSREGPLPARIGETVESLSNRYRIVELVEAILSHPEGLNGDCPPIEQWLAENKLELLTRKDSRAKTLARRRRTTWGAIATSVVALLIAAPWILPPLPPPVARLPMWDAAFPVDGPCIPYISPDNTWQLLEERLKAAQKSIRIAVYELSARHIVDLLLDAKSRGVDVHILVGAASTTNGTKQVLDELEGKGIDIHLSRTGKDAPFFVYHPKMIVIDDEWTLIQSGNLTPNSVPLERTGNRDAGLAIKSPQIAGYFRGVFETDSRLIQSSVNESKHSSELERRYKPTFFVKQFSLVDAQKEPATKESAIRVLPVLSPDNYVDAVSQVLMAASQEIVIYQQYIAFREDRSPALSKILDAVVSAKRSNPKLRVRIILREPFGSSNQAPLLKAIERLDLDINEDVRILNPKSGLNCSNKLVVIDRRVSFVGSANWSENGVTKTRNICLLIDSEAVGRHFADLFDVDWSVGKLVSRRIQTQADQAVTTEVRELQQDFFATQN